MLLEAHSLGIRFGQNWLFRNIDVSLEHGSQLAILGANGSGKSTLVKILTGYQEPSEGKITWKHPEGTLVPEDLIYRYYALAAPYLELFEELSLKESYQLHEQLKPMKLQYDDILTLGYFHEHQQKAIKQFSSGMKQRLKLLLAFASAEKILFLDEPCSNLDVKGKDLYKELVRRFTGKLSMVVASNDPDEYYFCSQHIQL